jgi:pimeloyl-ACP methyl ester carboxylesterase
MSRLIFILVLFLSAGLTSQAQSLSGEWEGYIDVNGVQLTIIPQFNTSGSGYTGSLDIPQQGANGIPLQRIRTTKSDSVYFRFQAGGGYAEFEGVFETVDKIAGQYFQNGQGYPFQLERQPISDGKEEAYRIDDLTISSGDVKIGGSLYLPRNQKPTACVVMISGSGRQTRSSTVAGFPVFKTLSEQLSIAQVATFIYDDRGSGSSTGSYQKATLSDLSKDVSAIVDELSQYPALSSVPIGLLGHSQGGVVAGHYLDQQPKGAAFLILMASPALPLSEVVLDQVEQGLRTQGASDTEITEQLDLQRAIFEELRGEQQFDELRSKIKSKIMDQIDSLPESTRAQIGNADTYAERLLDQQFEVLTGAPYTSMLDYDPRTDLSELPALPVLVLWGGKDSQVDPAVHRPEVNQALASSPAMVTVRTFSDANHLFQRAESGLVSEYGQLEGVFISGFTDVLLEWIEESVSKN